MDDKRHESIKNLLNILGYKVNNLIDIENLSLDHSQLRSKEIKDKFYKLIPEMKELYDSHHLTCLHNNSNKKQKFPAVNMIRQILKYNGYKLTPKVISKGYNPFTKHKITERFYIINKSETKKNNIIEKHKSSSIPLEYLYPPKF